jgi:hypothetical protein
VEINPGSHHRVKHLPKRVHRPNKVKNLHLGVILQCKTKELFVTSLRLIPTSSMTIYWMTQLYKISSAGRRPQIRAAAKIKEVSEICT